MKAFLVLLVCIGATCASEPQLGEDHKSLDIAAPSDGISKNVVESVASNISKNKRQERDVSHILGIYTTLRPTTDNVANNAENLDNVLPLSAGVAWETPEDSVTVTKQRVELLENVESELAENVQQHVLNSESPRPTQLPATCSAEQLQENLNIPKRSARDVKHLLETQTTLSDKQKDHKAGNTENTPASPQVVEELLAPLAPVPEQEYKPGNTANTPPSPQEVKEPLAPLAPVPEHLTRPTRCVAELLQAFTSLAPHTREELEKELGPKSIQNSTAKIQPSAKEVAQEIVQHVALQDHLQRHARDVVHLMESSITFASALDEKNSDKVSLENQKVAVQLETLQDHLDRKVRDVSHLLETPLNLSQAQLQYTEKSPLHVPEVIQHVSQVAQANLQLRAEELPVERHVRDVLHLLDSTLKRSTKDVDTKENDAEYPQQVEFQAVIAPEELFSLDGPTKSVNADLPTRSKRSAEAISLGASDQIVEDDQIVEKIVGQPIKKPTYGKKTKRSSENIQNLPDYIQKVAKVSAAAIKAEDATSKSDKVLHEIEGNKKLGEIENVDPLTSPNVLNSDFDMTLKRVTRSAETSTNVPLEISTANLEPIDRTTTEAVEVRESVKPTVKVQHPHPRLPLTAFAQRNTGLKATRRSPDLAVTIKPKVIKKRY